MNNYLEEIKEEQNSMNLHYNNLTTKTFLLLTLNSIKLHNSFHFLVKSLTQEQIHNHYNFIFG